MRIRDVVNKTVTTITDCESEPIHIPGSIQPHGGLIALQSKSYIIDFCSANIAAFLGKPPVELLNQSISAALPTAWSQLEGAFSVEDVRKMPMRITIGDQALDVIIHKGDRHLLLEFESATDHAVDANLLYHQTTQFVTIIEQSKSLKELSQKIAEEVRALTGYDRVMIYRFDKDYNGEVFAESKEAGLEPLLGLHYPHTDIPAQARELYLRKLLRLITDVNYQPVPLVTINNGQDKQLDLSDSTLRSVSPIHIQYLKNLGVAATLTISILLDGKLWGLIACHHYQPKSLTFAQRQTALLQGHFLSSQIRVRQVAEEYDINIQVEAHLQLLLNKIEMAEDFSIKFEHFTSLLAVANASGVIILHKGQLFEQGLVPPKDKVMALISWLATTIKSTQFTTSSLISRYPEAANLSRWASGIIYQSLGKPTENCIIWFREEQDKTVNWAGNPHKAVGKEPTTNMLMPRTSFQIWKERVQYTSKAWRVSEVNAAFRFATALQNHFHLLHLEEEEYRQRLLNEKLLKANKELSNINWITSHDLKEPLRKIQIFASKVLTKDEEQLSDIVNEYVQKIQKSANRMQQLVDDILLYSLTEEKDVLFKETDMNLLLEEVRENQAEELTAKGVTVIHDSLPTVNVIPHQIKQLFNNLLSNAIKFLQADREPSIRITCEKVSGEQLEDLYLSSNKNYFKFTMADNGIGFSPEFNKRIFDIFYRLHTKEAYKGTGIGLAIVQKIIDNHQGAIRAEGKIGEGAIFTFYLPA
jgi:chemotaxis family two-component system sensor kinase Cph1